MAQTWPVGVPTDVLINGYNESPPDNVLRSPMDVGPDKIRQRSTSAPRPMTWVIVMTTSELATFDSWFTGTLSYGALTFNFTLPRTSVSDEVRFTSQPDYQKMGGDYWSVVMPIEVMP